MSVDPSAKVCSKERIEKHILRKAFDTPERPFLPDSILWRQKEQFSDGVGYSWINGLKAYTEKEVRQSLINSPAWLVVISRYWPDLTRSQVSDAQFADAKSRFPEDTPATKEAYFYRAIFEQQFPHPCARSTVLSWVPTWSTSTDPSGRAQGIHADALPEAKK